MPKQETYFEKTIDGRHLAVVKSYDSAFAREAFDVMEESALAFLGRSLTAEGKLEVTEGAALNETEYAETLWEGIEEGAREDWNTFSYFIVMSGSSPIYVSSDWPSAEAYATQLTEMSAG